MIRIRDFRCQIWPSSSWPYRLLHMSLQRARNFFFVKVNVNDFIWRHLTPRSSSLVYNLVKRRRGEKKHSNPSTQHHYALTFCGCFFSNFVRALFWTTTLAAAAATSTLIWVGHVVHLQQSDSWLHYQTHLSLSHKYGSLFENHLI